MRHTLHDIKNSHDTTLHITVFRMFTKHFERMPQGRQNRLRISHSTKITIRRAYDTHFLLHTDLLRHKLLEPLDPQSRLCLYHYEIEPLESLARHADQILSRTTSLHNSPTDMVASNQQLVNESVEAKLGSIEQSIAKLNQTANNSHIEKNAAASNQRGSYSKRTPSRFVPPQRRVIQFSSGAQNDLCRYHTRYGE